MHDGVGYPVETTSNSAGSVNLGQPVPSSGEMGNYFYHGLNNQGYRDTTNQNVNRKENGAINRGPFAELQKTIRNSIELLRPLAELQELVRKLLPSTSQQSIASLLPSNMFQISNIIASYRLPTGYRVRFCNRCLEGNMCEPVFGSIQMEALSKELVEHCCMPKAIAALDQQQNKGDLMKRIHGDLISMLTNIVNLRIGINGTRDGADLDAKELDNDFLTQYRNTTLPIGEINRIWKKPADFIDLGPLINRGWSNNMNMEDHWVIRAIKKDGHHPEKIIKLDVNELREFLWFTQATYGVFRYRVSDYGPVRSFLMSVVF